MTSLSLSQILSILEGLEGEENESYCNRGFGKPLKKDQISVPQCCHLQVHKISNINLPDAILVHHYTTKVSHNNNATHVRKIASLIFYAVKVDLINLHTLKPDSYTYIWNICAQCVNCRKARENHTPARGGGLCVHIFLSTFCKNCYTAAFFASRTDKLQHLAAIVGCC